MAGARPVVYSWAMESEREHSTKGGAPVAAMATRVAQLWRAQGDEFLERTHADVEYDVARLRDTAIEEPDAALDRVHRLTAGVESTVHRLSEWDHAVMESLRTWRGESGHERSDRNRQQQLLDEVVDLRTPEPLVDLTGFEPVVTEVADADGWCAKHGNHHASVTCHKCEQSFCDDFVLRPGGDVAPLCMDCALVVSGIRRHH
jgi:hypothetical protein